LERSVLERKERDELAAIAEAMGVKANSRTSKANLIEGILREAGVETADEKPKRAKTAKAEANGEERSEDVAATDETAANEKATANGAATATEARSEGEAQAEASETGEATSSETKDETVAPERQERQGGGRNQQQQQQRF